jgi:hypothetical protein
MIRNSPASSSRSSIPPEELVKHMQSLIEQEQSSSAQDGHGLLLDRVV